MRLPALLVLPVLASAQTTPFTGPITLTQNDGFLMVEWSQAAGFSTRLSGSTDTLYFYSPRSTVDFMTMMPRSDPGQIAAYDRFGLVAVLLQSGATVDATLSFSPNNTLRPAGGVAGYFGFSHTEAGVTHYGWGQFSSAPTTFTLEALQMGSAAGVGVVVGQAVPEPSTYGLGLAGLALGIAAVRRRRASR